MSMRTLRWPALWLATVAALTLLGLAAPAPAHAASGQARRCTPSVGVSHSTAGVTIKLNAPCAGTSVRPFAASGVAGITYGIWIDRAGQTSTALRANTTRGGWCSEPTGDTEGCEVVHQTFTRTGHVILTALARRGCNFNWRRKFTYNSLVWLSGCSSGVKFYNHSKCVYRFTSNWVNGPERQGNGSENSNNSYVQCASGGNTAVVDIVYNAGHGWFTQQLYP